MLPLYIKHRPKKFEEVYGHKRVVDALKNRVKEKNIPQVMFFQSTTGLGKSTLARIVAKTIVCENIQNQYEPCNECKFCKDIDDERFSMFYEYDATQMKKDDIRGLKEITDTRSLLTPKKVIFIDELDSLQSGTMQPLYKLLEKKQTHTYFILGAMSSIKVPQVVRDRMVTYKLFAPASEEIGEYLYNICLKEGLKLTKEQVKILLIIAENSDNSFRGAVSKLETVLESNLWTEVEVRRELGFVSNEQLLTITGKILSGDMSVMENEFDEDMIKKIRNVTMWAYKIKHGIDQSSYIQNQVGKLPDLPEINFVNSITMFNDLQKYVYITPQLLESNIMFTVLKNKGGIVKLKEEVISNPVQTQPKKRRRSV